jgi:hypothetical protein
MNLEELTKGINAEVENLKALKKERSDLKAQTIQTIDKNCKDIVLPVLEAYTKILQSIDFALDSTGFSMPNQNGYCGKPLSCGLKMYMTGTWIGFTLTSRADIGCGRSSRSYGCTNIDYAPYWLSVENTQKSVNDITEVFCEYLQKCVDVLNLSSAAVAAQVQKLKDALSASNTVQKNEDGTVEITLGGVRYIGTVVKE